MNRFDRSFARAQYAYDNMSPPEYDEEEDEDACEGAYDDCDGCECCTEQVTRSKDVLARKARGSILPGDLVRVTTGFNYQINGGPRLGYLKRESIIAHGPGHGPEKMGAGRWHLRGGFRAVHPSFADVVEAREADAKAKADAEEAVREAAREVVRETDRVAREVAKAERGALCAASDGETVAYQGSRYTVGAWYTKTVYHSGLEYNGDLCDATCYSQRTLTDTESGETREWRI